ncbi:nuclear transport factor 2 family protein [Nitrospirillum sp. BR 11752]|uniref:nuclear transport factor 2 family protein n=1 Tax=Nitrospirillum sp. BR 11752 TaxID=3104293 RepID=UPI002EA3EB13|nr:nuclear transport factor 2 family protein [Nitrospirillum sp. BR 11752]
MSQTETDTDYNSLLRSNLERVFNERDPERRAAALAELYVEDPIMFEPDGVVRGRDAIGAVAGKLLDQFGPTFSFSPDGAAVGHHGLAVLRWHAGPHGGPVMVTGADAAEFESGRIVRLWVLLDTPPSP